MKLKKIQLNLGKDYWNNDKLYEEIIPERHSLLEFLLKYEFKDVPELSGKTHHHILITKELTSYWRIRNAIYKTRR